ncbi:MAG: hypothetical protein WKF87_21120 [Chryseolinea sp.]
MVIEEGIPFVGYSSSRSLWEAYPLEWVKLNELALSGSIGYKTEVRGKQVAAIRKYLHDNTEKRFVMKRVNEEDSRIWRIEDGTPLRGQTGKTGKKRAPWGSLNKKPNTKMKSESAKGAQWGWSRKKKEEEAVKPPNVKGQWGGARTKKEVEVASNGEGS